MVRAPSSRTIASLSALSHPAGAWVTRRAFWSRRSSWRGVVKSQPVRSLHDFYAEANDPRLVLVWQKALVIPLIPKPRPRRALCMYLPDACAIHGLPWHPEDGDSRGAPLPVQHRQCLRPSCNLINMPQGLALGCLYFSGGVRVALARSQAELGANSLTYPLLPGCQCGANHTGGTQPKRTCEEQS